jgi:nitrogen fixation/metabolism regulation signal transduction histidine kinase
MTLLISLWASIYLAQRLLAPLRDLAEGTRAISKGDYGKILPVHGSDELGVLVESFNLMTRQISSAQKSAIESQQLAESEHAYLNTVLTHLSAGVLTLSSNHELITFNAAAERILENNLENLRASSIDVIAKALPNASSLLKMIKEGISGSLNQWQKEISISGSDTRHTLICSGTRIESESGDSGYVIVFEDATDLLKAQRDAAWGEVARRLAHEIKNPLTPIQLSAERIRRKYLATLTDEDRETLDRSTRTIIQQVETMKTMVNAFSDYARPAPLDRKPTDVNQLVVDTVDLFLQAEDNVGITMHLQEESEAVVLDPNAFRQVLNNVIINAHDAFPDRTGEITISTQINVQTNSFQIMISDNGPGFPVESLERIFEPYVTSKEKGTGLGLAICRRIIEEHGGVIRAVNAPEGGATVIISIPVRQL